MYKRQVFGGSLADGCFIEEGVCGQGLPWEESLSGGDRDASEWRGRRFEFISVGWVVGGALWRR